MGGCGSRASKHLNSNNVDDTAERLIRMENQIVTYQQQIQNQQMQIDQLLFQISRLQSNLTAEYNQQIIDRSKKVNNIEDINNILFRNRRSTRWSYSEDLSLNHNYNNQTMENMRKKHEYYIHQIHEISNIIVYLISILYFIFYF